MHEFLVGVDEAGRGPLAGPVAVGAAVVPVDFDWSLLPGVADSKTLTPEDRDAVFRIAKELEGWNGFGLAVAMVSARVIDRVGITRAVAMATARALRRLECDPRRVFVQLDGRLTAPREYANQETIVRGDASEPAISLASIMAKVTRDRYMVRFAKREPAYGFDEHKGYGTKAHREAIREHGLSTEHRSSFCKNIAIL